MWQKFLRQPDMRTRSATRPTVLHFPSSHRGDWTQDERVEKLERWATRMADRAWRTELLGDTLDQMVRRGAELDAGAAAVVTTRTWRFRKWILGAPVLGAVGKALAARAPRRVVARRRRARG